MARNTKRSAAAAAGDAPTAAATAVEEAQTAAQSLATLGGGGGGADDTAPKKKARTTRGGAAATAAAEEAATTETTAEAPAATEAPATTEATRRSTRGGGAPAATTTKEEPEAEEAAAAAPIKEDEEMAEPEPTTTPTAAEEDATTTTAVVPPTTPSRVAGANVLASLGGSGEAKPELLDLESRIPTLPSDPVVVEVATAGGAAQHDYLLQNLVHATQVTSPLPVPSTKNRKEKSLGVLCRAFLELYKDAPPNRDNNGTVIEICQVAEHLGVKRRRIYDVINILESLDIVCRVKKNTYRWHGKEELPKFFAKLQYEGKKEEEMMVAAAAAAASATPAAPAIPAAAETETKEEKEEEAAEATTDAAAAETTAAETATPPSGASKRVVASTKIKGMAQTCRKLIQSFLVTNRTEIGLTEAAEEVLGPLSPSEESNAVKAMKTKVRRMYDIANVLQSIGILSKENVGSTSLTNKPSFRWVYPTLPSEMSQFLNMTEVEAAEAVKKVEEAANRAAAAAAAEKKVAAAEAEKKVEENPTVEV
ncbi:hypothetical protein ACHAWU_003283 [Discostella pseudostelligera]|uniref:E2F/DP family winged-helix DNA-binding domain-containing protein n=1 Tax=Discostella pseudostelligera TaxID=259834 RepID=A0ABD3MUV4_9STRA